MSIDNSSKIADLLIEKFVSEEIMTKSEFNQAIDRIMNRHEANINNKFQHYEASMANIAQKFDNWFKGIELRFDNKFQTIRNEMQAMESRIDNQFLKIDHRYNWIIGVTITSAIGIIGLLFKLILMLPH